MSHTLELIQDYFLNASECLLQLEMLVKDEIITLLDMGIIELGKVKWESMRSLEWLS